MAFDPASAFFTGFPVKAGVVGERHIVYPAADPAMQVMMGIQPPIVADQSWIACNLKDFPLLLQDRKITVYRPRLIRSARAIVSNELIRFPIKQPKAVKTLFSSDRFDRHLCLVLKSHRFRITKRSRMYIYTE
jgi:hypothetical protein